MLRQEIRNKVVNVHYTDGRLMMIRLKRKQKNLVIIPVYVSISQYGDEEVGECYEKIEQQTDREKKSACVIVMGDW